MTDYESFQWFAAAKYDCALYLKEKAQHYRHTTSGAKAGHTQSIQLRINLIITPGDARNDNDGSKPKEELSAKCSGMPSIK